MTFDAHPQDPLQADQPARNVSVVVPTRNRVHTLRQVAESYCDQDVVDELILVDDAGSDGTAAFATELAAKYQAVTVRVIRNQSRMGASASRNRGVAEARNPFVQFCDDDEKLEAGYVRVCRDKLVARAAGAVSGRRVYMREGETFDGALHRFGDGSRNVAPYLSLICEHVGGAHVVGDVELPFTNAVILTRTDLAREFGFDDFYARGNGYREESDYQMNLFVHGHTILMTSQTHSIHLPPSKVRTGGQRVRRWERLYWSIYYTSYFYRKYWDRYAARQGLRVRRTPALICFAFFAGYKELLRPSLSRLILGTRRLRGRFA